MYLINFFDFISPAQAWKSTEVLKARLICLPVMFEWCGVCVSTMADLSTDSSCECLLWARVERWRQAGHRQSQRNLISEQQRQVAG